MRRAQPKITVAVDKELFRQLQQTATSQGLTISRYVRLKLFGFADTEYSTLQPDLTISAPLPQDWTEARERYIQRSLEIAELTRGLQDDWIRWSRALRGDHPTEGRASIDEIRAGQLIPLLEGDPSPEPTDPSTG